MLRKAAEVIKKTQKAVKESRLDMSKKRRILSYFSLAELLLWFCSVLFILLSFLLFDGKGYLSLVASLIGATSLIFLAKGNPIGQVLVIVFSMIYAYISESYSYYGELITYACMTLPMAVVALVSWLRNPHGQGHLEVRISGAKKREIPIMLLLSVIVTVIMYFVLSTFGTANIIPSTASIFTSFIAVYLTFRRSPYYALAYAVNDIVLIVLWSLAAVDDITYLSMISCFAVFLANDIYGFFNWKRMQRRQRREIEEAPGKSKADFPKS